MAAEDAAQDTRAVEAILAAAWGGPVRLGPGTQLQDRVKVLRFPVLDAPPGSPATVVVKGATPHDDTPYEPDAMEPHSQAVRLFNDWAGLALLQELGGTPVLAPRLYAGDRARGWMVLEDLGDGGGLDQVLLGTDPAAAQTGLLALATGLGQLHARTIGQQARYDRLRAVLGRPTQGSFHHHDWLERNLTSVLATLAITPAPGMGTDLAALVAAMRDPGPFLAYTHGDPCLDNWLLTANGIRLIDFEIGQYRHALLDGVYGRIHFPTCWCMNRLPPEVSLAMETAYRAALVPGCPAATDDGLFYAAVVEACAYWAILTLGINTTMSALLEADHEWGVATLRQRVLFRLALAARLTAERGILEGLGETFAQIAAVLRPRWAEVPDLPLYPAFRPPG